MKQFNLILLGSVALSLWGCAEAITKDAPQMRTMNGVKLISQSSEDGQDAHAMSQASYRIKADQRLLFRYENLGDVADQISTVDGKKVEVLIATPDASSLADAQKSLKICPLKKNWMMEATWSRAHPFSRAGVWSTPGGDFDLSECSVSTSIDSGFAVFDVTPWFLNYVRGSNQNFGLIVISDSEVVIAGDTSMSLSPRIRWTTKVSILQTSN